MEVGRALTTHGIRAKLSLSQPGDAEEDDADRVANAVVGGQAPSRHRCASCEEDPVAHRKAEGGGRLPTSDDIHRAHAALRVGGHPLAPSVRATLEPRLGRDLSDVHVHTDDTSAAAARGIGARAYTVGSGIAFAAGEFRPVEREGQRLLAHELAHVALHGGATVRRQQAPAAAATPVSPGAVAAPTPEPATKGHTASLFGVTISESKDQVVFALKAEVAAHGRNAPNAYLGLLERHTGTDLEAARRFKKDVETDPSGVSGGVPASDSELKERETVRDLVMPVLRDAVAEVNRESDKILADFQDVMKQNALQTLAASKLRTEAQRIRYGSSTKHETKLRLGRGGISVQHLTTHAIADTASPVVTDLRNKAEVLLARRYAIRAKAQERQKHIACAQGNCAPDSQFAAVEAEVQQLRRAYRSLHAQIVIEHPVLDRIAGIEEEESLFENAITALTDLERVAKGDAALGLASAVGEQLETALEENDTARAGVEADKVNLWRLTHVFGVSKTQVGGDTEPFRKKLIEERHQQEQPNVIDQAIEAIAVLVLNIGAIALAAPTGGVSLLAGFGVNTALAASHTMDYLLNKATAGSDLVRAQSLSQDDPSLFWLAVEIIGVGFEGATAAATMLKAFRTLAPLVKTAQVVVDGEEAAKSLQAVRTAATTEKDAEFAERVVTQVKGLRRGETAAAKAAAVTEDEAKLLGAAGKAADAEAVETVGKAVETAGGKVGVSKTGRLFSCASPCFVLSDKYPTAWARDKELNRRLLDLERRARDAATARNTAKDAKAIAEAEKVGDQLSAEAAALERDVLKQFPDLAGTIVESEGAVAALRQVEEESAVVKGRLPADAAKLEGARPVLNNVPEGVDPKRWAEYVGYFEDRLASIKQGPGAKGPLTFEAYEEFLGTFKRGTEFQSKLAGALAKDAEATKALKGGTAPARPGEPNLFAGMEDPGVETNVAILEKGGKKSKLGGPVLNFPDHLVFDKAAIREGKKVSVRVVSDKSRDFGELFQRNELREISAQARADANEAVTKYGTAITLRRSNPESALAKLHGETVTVTDVTIAYESRMLPADARAAEAVRTLVRQAIEKPGVHVMFR